MAVTRHPRSVQVSPAWDVPVVEMPLQSVRATENPPTTSHHLPSIESHNRCTCRDLPSRIVSQLNRNTAANDRSVDHLRVVGVDVTPEVYFARGFTNVAASLAAKVSALVDRVVVGRSLAFRSTSSGSDDVLVIGSDITNCRR